MASELIVGNSDFGDNIFAMWRSEVGRANRPYVDGKWRMFLFGTEYG